MTLSYWFHYSVQASKFLLYRAVYEGSSHVTGIRLKKLAENFQDEFLKRSSLEASKLNCLKKALKRIQMMSVEDS